MIFPKPYTSGIRTSILFGISTTYSIDAATIATDIGAGRTSTSTTVVQDYVRAYYQTLFPLVTAGYMYFIVPVTNPIWPVFAYQADKGDETKWTMFPSELVKGNILWVKQNNFDYASKHFTLYKIKCITTGSASPDPAVVTQVDLDIVVNSNTIVPII